MTQDKNNLESISWLNFTTGCLHNHRLFYLQIRLFEVDQNVPKFSFHGYSDLWSLKFFLSILCSINITGFMICCNFDRITSPPVQG